MIRECISDGDSIGDETAMYFSYKRMLWINLFAIEYTSESLLLLVNVYDRVVLVEGKATPFTQ